MKKIILFILIFSSQLFSQITWHSLPGTANYTITVIKFSGNGNIYAGTKSNGIIKSTNGGESWEFKNNGIPISEIKSILITKNNLVFAGSYGEGLYRTNDGGDNWQKIYAGITNTVITSLIQNDQGIIYAGSKGGGVFYSDDNGSNWNEINTGLLDKDIVDLALNSHSDLFAGTDSYGVFQLPKGNTYWNEINIGMPKNKDILSVLVNKNDDVLAATAYDGIYISEANSLVWSQTALQYSPCWDLELSTNGDVWAATGGTVYFSQNGGRTFTFTNNGLPDSQVLSLAYNNGIIWAGTLANGIYKSTTTTSINEGIIPLTFQLYQNYPNPFNPVTKIKFTIPAKNISNQLSEFASLKVYDILCNEIALLLNEEVSPGHYEILFDASKFSSGVYFCKLTFGRYSQTKKMILLK